MINVKINQIKMIQVNKPGRTKI